MKTAPLLVAIFTLAILSRVEASADGVKTYLLEKLSQVQEASRQLVGNSAAYAALISAHGGSVEAAWKADRKEMEALVARMQENYKQMDSFGYETVEGIVAGVPSLADHDVYLDAGVPAAEGPENVAPVTLQLTGGVKIEGQGALFTYIIEPVLWGGSKRWVTSVGDGRVMPKPEILTAAAKDAARKIDELVADAKAWRASEGDCFSAMIVMTPTLSDYFEDWKESRYSETKSGRFQAVSRISDMRGIMGSCQVMYEAVSKSVSEKDKALSKSVSSSFREIMAFLDKIEEREKRAEIVGAEIDELATQAKEKTDKLVPPIEQSAALAGVNVST